jgi:hypothetical protein
LSRYLTTAVIATKFGTDRDQTDLDLQHPANVCLLWLFVHIPFTYSLILLGLAHGVIATLYAVRW